MKFPDWHYETMTETDLSPLQKRVIERMAATGQKPAPLAIAIGRSDSFIRDIVRGKTKSPAADALDALARGLNTTADYLLGKTDNPSPLTTLAPLTSRVPLMGYIGAGAEISPEFEQVPEDGLEQIEIPFPLPDPMLAFEVRGVSMKPRYDDGDVVVVWRDQRRATETFIGEEVAVHTRAGNRYVKTLARAPRGFNLISFNAPIIEAVDLIWIGEIYVTVRASQFRRIARR